VPSVLSQGFPYGASRPIGAASLHGLYRDQVLPRFQDKVMGRRTNRPIRERVCEVLHGDVLEVGFGTGLNVWYYPSDVTKVVAIEPSEVCMRIAKPRTEKQHAPVEYGGLTGEQLDLPDSAFDAALSTWTLCTIPNMQAALAEIRRVLKPGGSFHFVEHGHAPDEKVQRVQRRIEPLNKLLAGGCHLTPRHARRDRTGRVHDRPARHVLLQG
jgi:ubiquinone/menaquinone biosynthesis C-methylase UbiE